MTTVDYPDIPLHDLMRRTAARWPERPALSWAGRTRSFGEFEVESTRVANALHALGLGRGDRLSLYLPNCPEYELLFYGASMLGAIACPLNAAYRDHELTHQINDAGATVVAVHHTLWPVVERCRGRLGTVERFLVVGGTDVPGTASYAACVDTASTAAPTTHVDPRSLVALPYSSGTTGLPKGVMLSHRNLVCNHLQFSTASRLGPDDTFPLYLPLAHIYGVMLMGVALTSGCHQLLMERFDLSTLTSLVHAHRATWLHVVPPVLLALANAPELDASGFASVRYAMNAAAPLAPDVARRVEARLGLRVIQAYGLTETSPDTHISPLEPERIVLESVGVPAPDTEHRVVDVETGTTILAPGELGEIVVRGPQVMQGYWNAPEDTARVLRDGWLHTGDIGWIDRDGYAFVVDRKKEMIKYKGFSIAPAELESTILEHPDVADCGVVGVPDDEAGELPKAFVVPRSGVQLDLDGLTSFCASRLAGYKAIRRWSIVATIPRTPSGKILRRALKEQ